MDQSLPEVSSLSAFLVQLYEAKKKRNPRYSVRAWSLHLGYKNAAFVAQVMKEERNPNIAMIERIREKEKLDDNEWRHLKMLYLKSLYGGDDPMFSELLAAYQTNSYSIDLKKFELMSRWYFFAILELARIKDFVFSTENIRRSLKFDLADEEIDDAVVLLKKLGFLTAQGKRTAETTDKVGEIMADAPNLSIRRIHKSLIGLSLDAVDSQTMDERCLYSSTIGLSPDKVEEANRILREAHMKILNLEDDQEFQQVYQLNTQLFKLAENRSAH